MKNKGPITSDDIRGVEQKLDKLQEDMSYQIEQIKKDIKMLKIRSNYKLLAADKASEFIGITKRQLFNLADNPKVNIWRYNKDGSRKTNNRPTAVRFNFVELLEHKEQRERRKRRNR